MNTFRQNIAYTCFSLASLFKGLGRLIITKEQTIVVDALTLPGWFVVDKCIIHHINDKNHKIGFIWHTYSMPDEWCDQMQKMKYKN